MGTLRNVQNFVCRGFINAKQCIISYTQASLPHSGGKSVRCTKNLLMSNVRDLVQDKNSPNGYSEKCLEFCLWGVYQWKVVYYFLYSGQSAPPWGKSVRCTKNLLMSNVRHLVEDKNSPNGYSEKCLEFCLWGVLSMQSSVLYPILRLVCPTLGENR